MPRYANELACCAVRHTAVTQTPSSTRHNENATINGASASALPADVQAEHDDARAEQHDELRDRRSRSRGTDLPDDDLERGRRGSRAARSQVAHPCSEKNENVTSDTMKNAVITAWPGTTCSAPFACG